MPFDLTELLHALRQTAVERDRQGGHAAAEKARIREAGLLRLAVPQKHGGLEQPWPDIYRLVRQVATVDSSLATCWPSTNCRWPLCSFTAMPNSSAAGCAAPPMNKAGGAMP